MVVTPDLHRNTAKVLTLLQQARDAACDVVVFPETCLTGYLGVSLQSLEDLDPIAVHRAVETVREKCAELHIAATVGQYFKRCGLWYNNAVFIDKQGVVLASYDKCQLVDKDAYEVQPGQGLGTFSFMGQNCSVAICHDIRYPEILRWLAIQGSTIHFHLFYGPRGPSRVGDQSAYDAHLLTRAVENGLFIAAANAATEEQMVRSQARHPDGSMIAVAGDCQEQLIVCEIDFQSVQHRWVTKRRDDLFEFSLAPRPQQSFFERAPWNIQPLTMYDGVEIDVDH
jgi:predicted amidohydrolase